MDPMGGESVRTQYDWSDTDPSTAIVKTLAEIEGTPPQELDIVLFDHIDPDALDSLFPAKNGSAIEFRCQIEQYHVDIDGEQLTVRQTAKS